MRIFFVDMRMNFEACADVVKNIRHFVKKYEPCISKYKAHILKYVPYIFACSKCLKHSNLYEDEKTACFRGVSALLWNIYALAFGGVSEALLSTGVSLHRVRRNGRLVPCAHQHLRVRRCFW